jgi:predicted nucleic acid-binding protein
VTPVVADTGPIVSFARAGQLALLQTIVPTAWIPDAVYHELVVQGAGRPGASEVAAGQWALRKSIADPASFLGLSAALHLGEREAIALARETSSPLLVDDLLGRREAQRLGIDVLTSLTVLQQAKDSGVIGAIRPILDALMAGPGGFRLSSPLYETFLRLNLEA